MPERTRLRAEAARARFLIRSVNDPKTTVTLTHYAAECEAEAARLDETERKKIGT